MFCGYSKFISIELFLNNRLCNIKLMYLRLVIFVIALVLFLRMVRMIWIEFLKATNQKVKEGSQTEGKVEASDLKKYGSVLGLTGKVTKEEIKKAYREKVRKYHPDTLQNMAPEFQDLAKKKTAELNEAYEFMKKKFGI